MCFWKVFSCWTQIWAQKCSITSRFRVNGGLNFQKCRFCLLLEIYRNEPWRLRTFGKISNWILTFFLSTPCIRTILTYELEAWNATELNLEKITSWKLGIGVTAKRCGTTPESLHPLKRTLKLINPTCCTSK